MALPHHMWPSQGPLLADIRAHSWRTFPQPKMGMEEAIVEAKTFSKTAGGSEMDTIGEMAFNPCHIPAPAPQSINSRPKKKVLAKKTINSSL